MRKIRILWTDDEIEVLRPHLFFLREKGYDIDTCTNGNDTLDLVKTNQYDIIFLDEHMPGLSGIETFRHLKEIKPGIPVVMITKSEEEEIMEAAIGSEIADYLIKPVKPNQILLAIKRILEKKRLFTEKTTIDYRQEFTRISGLIGSAKNHDDWKEIYRKIVYWESELERSSDPGMSEILRMQEFEANKSFSKFISNNYLNWLNPANTEHPVLSPALLQKKVFPLVEPSKSLFFILIDNLRLDQWKAISHEITGTCRIIEEDLYFSILPTATQFSRNSIFAGIMPLAIAETMPEYWIPEEEEEGKNNFEEELLKRHLSRSGLNLKWSYHKINNVSEGKKVNEKIQSLLSNDFNVLVFNFVDMLSHARTEIGLIRDMAYDEKAYRGLTRSWFVNSTLYELLNKLPSGKVKIVFSTDHGTIMVQNPLKVVGDRNTTSNLRYKMGRNLAYDPSKVFEIANPEKAFLPKTNISSKYIFATNNDYLVYQNNYNHFAAYYKDTFQHGGISMQEMLLPVVILEPNS